MAYVVGSVIRDTLRRRAIVTTTLTVSGSYTQGTGELISASDFGMSQIHNILGLTSETTFGGYVLKPVPVSPVNTMFSSFNLLVLYGDNNNASDGPLIEIPTAAYPAGVSGATYWISLIGR